MIIDTKSRRAFLRLSSIFAGGYTLTSAEAAKSDFWNQKDPSQWSDAERERILTNSPWAHKAAVSMERSAGDGLAEGGPGGGGPPGGGMGGPPGGGMGGGGRGGGADMGGGGRGGGAPIGGDGGPMGRGVPKIEATVRWESAAPVRAVSRDTISAENDVYIISVVSTSGLNTGGRSGMGMGAPGGVEPGPNAPGPNDEDMVRRYQMTTQLEVKGEPLLHPRKVLRENDGRRIVFLFDRTELPITAASREATLSMRMGPMILKAKFIPKEMIYKEKIAL